MQPATWARTMTMWRMAGGTAKRPLLFPDFSHDAASPDEIRSRINGLDAKNFSAARRRVIKPCRECGRPFNGYTQRVLCDACKEKKRNSESYRRRIRRYKLTAQQHAELLSGQAFKCANPRCPSRDQLQVDHSHETGAVRGLLCRGCNMALGHLVEDPERMLGLAEYISTRDRRGAA
jgi:hypothetical protein